MFLDDVMGLTEKHRPQTFVQTHMPFSFSLIWRPAICDLCDSADAEESAFVLIKVQKRRHSNEKSMEYHNQTVMPRGRNKTESYMLLQGASLRTYEPRREKISLRGFETR